MTERKMAMDPRDPTGQRWGSLALCLGYNELAKRADNLGSKLFFRMMCDEAEKQFVALGGEKFIGREGALGTIDVGVSMPTLFLYEADIELMRKIVAEHDAKTAPVPPEEPPVEPS